MSLVEVGQCCGKNEFPQNHRFADAKGLLQQLDNIINCYKLSPFLDYEIFDDRLQIIPILYLWCLAHDSS
jgi:hypothetical protein